jgi:hypothetical protein
MPGHGEKLSRKKSSAIVALFTEPTITQAAEKVGVDESTLRRWLKEDSFKKEFRTARRDVVETAVGRLQQSTSKAVETLERNLNCGQFGSEIRAALGILENAVKAVELIDLAERLEQLETRMAEKENKR